MDEFYTLGTDQSKLKTYSNQGVRNWFLRMPKNDEWSIKLQIFDKLTILWNVGNLIGWLKSSQFALAWKLIPFGSDSNAIIIFEYCFEWALTIYSIYSMF